MGSQAPGRSLPGTLIGLHVNTRSWGAAGSQKTHCTGCPHSGASNSDAHLGYRRGTGKLEFAVRGSGCLGAVARANTTSVGPRRSTCRIATLTPREPRNNCGSRFWVCGFRFLGGGVLANIHVRGPPSKCEALAAMAPCKPPEGDLHTHLSFMPVTPDTLSTSAPRTGYHLDRTPWYLGNAQPTPRLSFRRDEAGSREALLGRAITIRSCKPPRECAGPRRSAKP